GRTILRSSRPQELFEHIQATGQTMPPDLILNSHPTESLAAGVLDQGTNNTGLTADYTPRRWERLDRVVSAFDMKLPWLSDVRAFVQAYDTEFKSNIFNEVYVRTQLAARATESAIHETTAKVLTPIDRYFRGKNLNADQRAQFSA